MRKFIICLFFLSSYIYADNIFINESLIKQVEATEGSLKQSLSYTSLDKLVGHHFYLVNSSKVQKKDFFVKSFKTEKYIVYADKLDKYRLFNKLKFTDLVDKIFEVKKARYVKVEKNFGYSTDYIEFSLEDIENPDLTFKYVAKQEYGQTIRFPFIDINYYKSRINRFNQNTRYKIRTELMQSASSNPNIWWSYRGLAFNDELFSVVYIFDSNRNTTGYVLEENVYDSCIMNEVSWQTLCTNRGEEFARLKLQRKIKYDMPLEDVLEIMGRPDGVAYDNRDIWKGFAILRYGEQWVAINNNKVVHVDFQKYLWDKGDMWQIEQFRKKLYL